MRQNWKYGRRSHPPYYDEENCQKQVGRFDIIYATFAKQTGKYPVNGEDYNACRCSGNCAFPEKLSQPPGVGNGVKIRQHV
ncbi:MAG: hypothetical protein V7679_12060 [Parasphingorhabdus sp.]